MEKVYEEIIRRIKEIYDYGEIITGTSNELKIVDYIVSEFREMGVDAQKTPLKVMSWQPIEATIRVGREEVEATLQPYSPTASIEGRLVHIRSIDRDLEKIRLYDAIVLIELSTVLDDYELQYYKLMEAGAQAIIFYDPYPNRRRRLVATGSLNYSYNPGKPLPIPILHVTREEGLRLVGRSNERIRITTKSRINHNAVGYNVIALVPGHSDKRIILSAHHDHWLAGVSDNIIGVALIIETTKYLLKEEIRNTLQIVSFTAEESGAPGFTPWYWAYGSRVFVREQEELGLIDNIIAVLNIDALARGILNINATGIEYQALIKSIADKLDIEYKAGLDHPYYDSFSFSSKGIPSATINTLDSITDIYHTDRDTVEVLEINTIHRAFTLTIETIKLLLKKENPLKEYGYLTYARKIYEKLEQTPIELKIRGYRLLEATRKALSENKYEKLFNAYKIINRELIKPLFRGKYDEDSGGFETILIPHIEVIEDMNKIRKTISLLEDNKIADALKTLENIPPQRIIPGEEIILTESLSRTIHKIIQRNPELKENMLEVLEEELNAKASLLEHILRKVSSILDKATNTLIA